MGVAKVEYKLEEEAKMIIAGASGSEAENCG